MPHPLQSPQHLFERVVVGVDGRAGGEDAVALARQLADPDAHVTLAYVHGEADVVPDWRMLPPGRREVADRSLEKALSQWGGPAVTTRVEYGPVGNALHRLAAERDATLLVVGASHHDQAGRVLIGDH